MQRYYFHLETAKACLTTMASSCAILPPPRTRLCKQSAILSRAGVAMQLACGMGRLGECG